MKKIFLLIMMFSLIGCAGQRHASRGWDYLKTKEYENAISEFELARQSNNMPGAYLGLFQTYFRMGDETKAVEYLNEGLQMHPEDGFLNWNMGLFLLNKKNDACGALPYLINTQKSRVGKGTASEMVQSDVNKAKTKCNTK